MTLKHIIAGAYVGAISGPVIGVLSVFLSNQIKGVNPAGTIYGPDTAILSSVCCLFPGIITGITGAVGANFLNRLWWVEVYKRNVNELKDVGIGKVILSAALTSMVILGMFTALDRKSVV
jgi:hypothetical protein